MNDLNELSDEPLAPIARVVAAVLVHAENLQPENIMVVGAARRDRHHRALRHTFDATATHDLDLALALPS